MWRDQTRTKKIVFITVSEISYQFELTIFSENLYKYRPILKEGNLLIFTVDIKNNTDTRFIIREISSLDNVFLKIDISIIFILI